MLPAARTLWPCGCSKDFFAVCRRKHGTDRGTPPTAGLLGRKEDCKHIGSISIFIGSYQTETFMQMGDLPFAIIATGIPGCNCYN